MVETSLAGGVDRLTLDYVGSDGNPQTVVTQFTESGSTSSTYRFARPYGTAGGLAWAPTSITAPCSLCGNTQATTTYELPGRVFKTVAYDDTPTFYQYDETGRETERATVPGKLQVRHHPPAAGRRNEGGIHPLAPDVEPAARGGRAEQDHRVRL